MIGVVAKFSHPFGLPSARIFTWNEKAKIPIAISFSLAVKSKYAHKIDGNLKFRNSL